MNQNSHAESIVIAADPAAVYRIVSDVTRTGEWSPVCATCWWKPGDEPGPEGPREGAWFVGRNVTPTRTWETESVVTAAEPGRRFAWGVFGTYVMWSYTMAAVDGGTRLTESWELTADGVDFFRSKYGDQADTQIAERRAAALHGIPLTLARIKEVAED